jgi:osmotically-inducible protein OsmY
MSHRILLLALLGSILGCAPMDRRPVDSAVDDELIESQSITQINQRHSGMVHVNVVSVNRHLLLTGEVPTEASKAEIARIVADVANVKLLSNELVVSAPAGIASRSKDSLITSDVKLRFANQGNFRAGYIKVVTENGVVYLLGRVYRKEGASAADLASITRGVQQVILMFEYLD